MRTPQQEIATPKIAISKPVTQTQNPAVPKKISGTKKLTYCATLIAVALIFKIIGNYMQLGTLKITLFYLPLMIAAVMINPIGAAVVGLGTDILGTFIAPTGGAPLPLIVLSNTMFPLIIGLIVRLPLKSITLKIIIGTVIATCVCTLGLTTFTLARLYNIPFYVQLITRLPQALVVAANAIIAIAIIPLLKHLKIIK